MGLFGRSGMFWLFFALLLVTACVPSGCGLDTFECNLIASVIDMDPAHCYQWIAVQNSDPDECAKVQSEVWAGSGQNPPKDKCYLKIAEKDVDPLPCDNIEGGPNSYSKDECYQGVGAKGGDADACAELSGDAAIACRTGVARGRESEGLTPDCGEGFLWQPGGLGGGHCVKNPDVKESPSEPAVKPVVKPAAGDDDSLRETDDRSSDEQVPPKDIEQELQRDAGIVRGVELREDAQQQKEREPPVAETQQSPAELVKENFEAADKPPTPEKEKQTRLSELVKDIDDPDARSTIIRAFIRERQRRDDLTIEQQRELLDEIRQEYEFNQLMDEKANTIKANTVDKLTEKVNELVEEKKQSAWDWFKEKTYGWVKGRTPDKYKKTAALAEKKYNEAVKKYNAALEKYKKGKDYFDKAKKAYDEVKQVMENVRRLQNKVKQGKITAGQAKVLKGGVLLGKGLEYATKYIPVFGETASEITAGTFQATMKFAEKRAERTTKLNSCIEDPLNCDPNGISAY